MIHNIKINGEIKSVNCKLGSGIYDKNDVEIFEGDKVKLFNDLRRDYKICAAYFHQGLFDLVDKDNWSRRDDAIFYPLHWQSQRDLEIINSEG